MVPITTEGIEKIEFFEVYIKNTPERGLDYPSKVQSIYPFKVDRAGLKEYLGKASRERRFYKIFSNSRKSKSSLTN